MRLRATQVFSPPMETILIAAGKGGSGKATLDRNPSSAAVQEGPNAFWTLLHRTMLAAVLVFASNLTALASCDHLIDDAQVDDILTAFQDATTAQLALRTALGAGPHRGLNDGIVGPRTRHSIRKLCTLVPHAEGLDHADATRDVMLEYLALSRAVLPSPQDPFDIDLEGDATGARRLALAATPVLTARAIRGQPNAFACDEITAVLADSPDAVRAMRVLTGIFKDRTEAQICTLFSFPPDPSAVGDAFARLGRLDTVHESALQTLLSANFLTWLNTDRTVRLRRLMATESAIVSILEEYAPHRGMPARTTHSGESCTRRSEDLSEGYAFVLTEDDIAKVKALVSIKPILLNFFKENPSYDSAEALWRDLKPVLQRELDNCILADVETLVTGPEKLPLVFRLKPDAAVLDLPPLAPQAGVLAELQNLYWPTRKALLVTLRATLEDSTKENLKAVVDRAAEAIVAKVANTTPVRDTLSAENPYDDQLSLSPQSTIGVTDAVDSDLETILDNADMTEQLRNATFTSASSPEQIKSQVRNVLGELVEEQTADAVNEQIALIEPLIEAKWERTRNLMDVINAPPYGLSGPTDTSGVDLTLRLESLTDVEYPNQARFEEALRAITNADGSPLYAPFLIENIVYAAAKPVPDGVRDAFVGLGRLDKAYGRAFDTLLSLDFLAWLDADRTQRLPRLMEVENAMSALLDDYAQTETRVDVAVSSGDGSIPSNLETANSAGTQKPDNIATRFATFPNRSGTGVWVVNTENGTVKFCFTQKKTSSTGGYVSTCAEANQ